MHTLLNSVLSIALLISANATPQKVYEMRITGYCVKEGDRGALCEPVRPGKHAAVSPGCIELLGERVYVKGFGVFVVNDLTADWLDTKFNVCTLDIARGTVQEAQAVGSNISIVVRIPTKEEK